MADGCRSAEGALHSNFIAGWDIPEAEKSPPLAKPTTVLYCSYLLRVVSVGSHGEGLAALLPCFWVSVPDDEMFPYNLFPYNPSFRNITRTMITYIFYARITDYMETHPYDPPASRRPHGTPSAPPTRRRHCCFCRSYGLFPYKP